MDHEVKRMETLAALLKEKIVLSDTRINDFSYAPCGYKTDNTPPADGWAPFHAGGHLSGKDRHFWFHFTFKTPTVGEREQVVFHLSTSADGAWDALNPQGLFYANGKTVQGLDINHQDVLLEPNTDYDAYIYFYIGMIDDNFQIEIVPSLQIIDREIEGLYYDFSVPLDALKLFEEEDGEFLEIMRELYAAAQLLDLRDIYSDAFYKSVAAARASLKEAFYTTVREGGPIVNCIGHTHIDVAWLWTLAQTREKTQRSFSTVLNLMKQYPEYQFMSSQPQLYKYLLQQDKETFEELKKAVKAGRWEPEGAMWLEADCNLTSGESLVRQIMYGKRFFKEQFNTDSTILWLPDVFGYSAALPQILRKCGVDTFVTSKISWNDENLLPYDTFMWKGIDGTEIFTYFITAQDAEKRINKAQNYTTYVGYIRPSQVLGTWKRYQQKDYNNEVMITYGYGDGGGGPTKDMIEQQRRLSYGLPGLPRTQPESATNMLRRVRENFDKNCVRLGKTPRWDGELYLEFHRGTYTSQAHNKLCNRKSELSYQAAESAAFSAHALLGKAYPKQSLQDGWETILLNQFHDIIPGSSIKEVYEDSAKQYEAVLKTAHDAESDAIKALAENVKTDGGVFVYNPNSAPFSGEVIADGKYISVQNIPGHGYKVVPKTEAAHSVTLTDGGMENKYYTLKFDDMGRICMLYDKEADRDIVCENGAINEFFVYEDFPFVYDAWEIARYHKDKHWSLGAPVSVEKADEGARKGYTFRYTYGKSTLIQTVYLYDDSRRIDFETYVDWHEDHVLLKAEFPMDIHATEASYEVQFGSVKRPNSRNTSWEQAKFEVCAQKWADLSEADYGVSLLNDCKYGHSAVGGTLTLSLLRAPTYPDPTADRGEHRFTYSLYPHNHALASDTVHESFALNRPVIALPLGAQDGTLSDEWSLVSSNNSDVIIDTAKMAEDGEELIVRLYSCRNNRAKATLTFGVPVKNAALCTMLEETESEIAVQDNSVSLSLKPFEIVTLKMNL